MEEKEKQKEVEVNEGSAINLNIGDLEGDMAQRLVELEARVAEIAGKLEEVIGNTDGEGVAGEKDEGKVSEEAIVEVEEAASTQAGDEAIAEEVYEDEEDIVKLRGNLKASERITKRRLNLADYIAEKTGQDKPKSLREANGIMSGFRKTHKALKKKAEVKWAPDSVVRHNAQAAKSNMDRLLSSWKKGS